MSASAEGAAFLSGRNAGTSRGWERRFVSGPWNQPEIERRYGGPREDGSSSVTSATVWYEVGVTSKSAIELNEG